MEKQCHQCEVWQRSLFRSFDTAQINQLAQQKQIRDYRKGESVFQQAHAVEGIFCHASGLVRIVQRDQQQQVRFARLVLPGDSSGHRSVFIEKHYKGSADVLSDRADICFIPTAAILAMLDSNAEFARALIIKIAEEVKRTEEEVISTREQNVRIRLARLLLHLREHFSEALSANQFVLKSVINKTDLASILLVANETVIRLMSEFKNEKIINYKQRRIVIADREGLQKIARL